jgi:hypothetical protein
MRGHTGLRSNGGQGLSRCLGINLAEVKRLIESLGKETKKTVEYENRRRIFGEKCLYLWQILWVAEYEAISLYRCRI